MNVLAFLIFTLALGLALAARGRRWGLRLAGIAAVVLFVWGWDPPAALFSATLERQFPAQLPFTGDAEAIVVLSGSFYPPDATHPDTLPGYGTYLRCHHAAMLYKQWKQTPVVVTAGPVSTRGGHVDSAPAMQQVLEDEGVPASMIWRENQSHTTYENAAHTAALLRAKGIHRIVLVTEAFHMPRSYRAFVKQGLTVLPSGCAYRQARFEGSWSEWLVPHAESMIVNETDLHEWIGLLWYRISGKG